MTYQPLLNQIKRFTRIIIRPCQSHWFWLICLLIAGVSLRFYQLGADSLWLDEAGVAYAARTGSIPEMLTVVRSHVLAMPLDYIIVWLVGRVSTSELALRLPAAVWGSLTLYLSYHFFRSFASRSAAMFGLLFLAFSPIHIQYSQELRFYASLVFFYLLSSMLLWKAMQQPTSKRWIQFCTASIIGVFFHPYVVFSLSNGILWLILSGLTNRQNRNKRIGFLISTCLILLAFLVGYLVFSASNFFDIPLLVYEESFFKAIATGLGWLPFYTGSTGISWLWGGLCAILQIIGAWTALKSNLRSPLAGLFYSLLLQFIAVVGSDIIGHYFFAPRQLLFLLPVLTLFSGIGLVSLIDWLGNRLIYLLGKMNQRTIRNGVTVAITLLLILASLPAIKSYQLDDKGNSRVIVQTILETWQPGDFILVFPGYEGFVYKYYIESVYRRPEVGARLWTVEWNEIQQAGDWTGTFYLITPARLTAVEQQQMNDLSFSRLFTSIADSRYAKVLWVR